jgi:hypothetical protein
MVYLERNLVTLPYLPFITGNIQSEINYGEEPYAWKSAVTVSSKQHISNYLYKLLGNRVHPNQI